MSKITKIVKPHHVIYIVLTVLLLAGASVGIYFYIKNKSSSPSHTQNECGAGEVECVHEGNVTCCATECCGGICLTTDQTCVNNIPCDNNLVCKQTDGSSICCTKDKPHCSPETKSCNACDSKNPPCEGSENKAPICCGKDASCFLENETDENTKNTCVCSNGTTDGMSGKCCSKYRSLCPGESYGQNPLSSKTTRDPKGQCAIKLNGTPAKKRCVTLDTDVGGAQLKNITNAAYDDYGKVCHKNLIFTDHKGNKACCGGTLYYNGQTIDCCTDDKIVGNENSKCYIKSEFTNLDENSPLQGMCSGISASSHNASVCVNLKNFNSSSFASATNKCPTGETPVTLPYYALINQPGKITYNSQDVQISNCPTSLRSATNLNTADDCTNLREFEALKCTSDTDCTNKTTTCVKIEHGKAVPTTTTTCNPMANPPTYESGICGVGCPKNNPKTICEKDEICYSYEAKDYESGFCGIAPSGEQTPTPDISPPHLYTEDDNGNTLYYIDESACKQFCEGNGDIKAGRMGYCDATNIPNGNGGNLYECKLPVCKPPSSDIGYIVNEKGIENLEGSNTITYKSGGSMAQCMLDQNKEYVDAITYKKANNDGGGECIANFDCGSMLIPDGISITNTYAQASLPSTLTGEKLYNAKVDQTGLQRGPFSTTRFSSVSCADVLKGADEKAFCINGQNCQSSDGKLQCEDSTPAGVY